MSQTPRSIYERIVNCAATVGDAASLAFVIAFLLNVYEITARFFFNQPTVWTLEITLLVTGAAYLLIGPQATATDAHIRIDILVDELSYPKKRILRAISSFLSACYGLVIVYSGYKLAAPLLDGIERTGSALNSPAPSIVKVLIPVVGLAWTLIASADLVRVLRAPEESKLKVSQ
jgi:TRAP-type C4-dicarboxylate transport system permease small subunit